MSSHRSFRSLTYPSHLCSIQGVSRNDYNILEYDSAYQNAKKIQMDNVLFIKLDF